MVFLIMKFFLKFLSITYQNKQKHKILAMPWLLLFIRNHHPTPTPSPTNPHQPLVPGVPLPLNFETRIYLRLLTILESCNEIKTKYFLKAKHLACVDKTNSLQNVLITVKALKNLKKLSITLYNKLFKKLCNKQGVLFISYTYVIIAERL